MSKKDFVKPYDEVFFVYSVLKRLNSGNMDSFNGRFKSQKVQYLAQVFGIVPFYPYNLYIHGPYAPTLANDLYLISAKDITPNKEKFLPEELEIKFDKLKKIIEDLDNRKLELVATLHWLIFKANYPIAQSIERLKELKSASADELSVSKKLLKQLCQNLKN